MSTKRKKQQPELTATLEPKPLYRRLLPWVLVALAVYGVTYVAQAVSADESDVPVEIPAEVTDEVSTSWWKKFVNKAVVEADGRLEAKKSELSEFEQDLVDREAALAERESEIFTRVDTLEVISAALVHCASSALKEVDDVRPHPES